MADPITGIGGKVTIDGSTVVAHVTRWRLEETADNQTYVTSSTQGWRETAAGAKGWTATFSLLLEAGGFIDEVIAALIVGSLLTDIEFYTCDGHYTGGSARVDRITDLEVDIEGSGNIGCTVEVTGHGVLNKV